MRKGYKFAFETDEAKVKEIFDRAIKDPKTGKVIGSELEVTVVLPSNNQVLEAADSITEEFCHLKMRGTKKSKV